MPDYEEMYHIMFNAVTDAESKMESAAIILRAAQQKCEDLYIRSEYYQPSGENMPHLDL